MIHDHADERARAFILKVGLTGGIASGKTTVAGHFAALGAAIIDADDIAHRLIAPGEAAYGTVTREFGPEIVRPDGTLDRTALGRIVFADPQRRLRLEAILHPLIHAEEGAVMDRLAADGGGSRIAVVNAALIIEAGFWRDYHRVVVVHCPPEVQVERIMRRDGLGKDDALARVATQMPAAEKIRLAHYAIDTSADFAATEVRAREVFRHLQHDLVAMAQAR